MAITDALRTWDPAHAVPKCSPSQVLPEQGPQHSAKKHFGKQRPGNELKAQQMVWAGVARWGQGLSSSTLFLASSLGKPNTTLQGSQLRSATHTCEQASPSPPRLPFSHPEDGNITTYLTRIQRVPHRWGMCQNGCYH